MHVTSKASRLAARHVALVRHAHAAAAAAQRARPTMTQPASHNAATPSPAPAPTPASASVASAHASTSSLGVSRFLGASSPFVSALGLTEPSAPLPCFRVMNEKAEFVRPDYELTHTPETMKRMYDCMVTLNEMDKILYDAQRQGRISFYMTSYGEEATHIGSASALDKEDVVFGQYREAGVLVWRGFTLDEFVHQCFSTSLDAGKGRQMPVHYGSRRLHFHTISSPLGTQIPQAAGAAYALKREGKENIAMCYFGEGAASEGDFHVALNMAATLSCPVVFFCRNNGYAISTPSKEQYKGDGIAARGLAYGMATIRVDGNDLLAVHDATKLARETALKENRPVLIEAMTYRGGHHSTSDDSTRYRGQDEIAFWASNENPITRFRLLLEHRGLWDSAQETSLRKERRQSVLQAMGRAERTRKPAASQMFADVYDEPTPNMIEQRQQLQDHLDRYAEYYPLDEYEREEAYVDQSIEDRQAVPYAKGFENKEA